MNTTFNYLFIKDKLKHAEYLKNIDDLLMNKSNNFDKNDETEKQYAKEAEKVLNNDDLLNITYKNPQLSNEIKEEFINYLNNTKQKVDKELLKYKEEENLLGNFINTENQFKQREYKSNVEPVLNKNYKKDEINVDYFNDEWNKINKITDLKEQIKKSEELSNYIQEKWNNSLFKKKTETELKIIDQERAEYLKDLYERIEKYKYLKETLEPFTDDCGRLWDMSKGVNTIDKK